MEAEVFKDDGETFVFKTINPYQFSLDPLEFLDRIAISNTLFDREQITVEGYGRNSDGDFFAVIKQPYIRIDRGLNEEEATAFMQRLGFKDLGKTFVNEDFVLDDLHSGNIVLDEKGIVRVIDAAAWLNTKEEGYAGKRVLGTLPRVENDVEMQSLEKSSRFKEIDRPSFDRLIKRLRIAIPTKVSTNFTEGRKVLKELNYDVDALFGNKTVAFTPHTKKLFEKAKEMERVGKSLQEITEQTGFLIGLDGNWKYAIDDSYARFIASEEEIDKFVKNGTEVPLKRVLIHEKLDQYYPELAKKIKVTFYEGAKNKGGYTENHSDGTYTIRVNQDFREENNGGNEVLASARVTLLHEVQHVVQGLDRSIRGSRFADLGGAQQEHLYKLLKRGKLKLYREGSDKEIKYRQMPN